MPVSLWHPRYTQMHLWRWEQSASHIIFDCNILRPPNCLEDLRSLDINNTKWLEDLVDFV